MRKIFERSAAQAADDLLVPVDFEGLSRFPLSPAEVAERFRDAWLEDIENGFDLFAVRLLPFLEAEAVRRMRSAVGSVADSSPKFGSELWRAYWVSAALEQAHGDPDAPEVPPDARAGLQPVAAAAVRVLLTCDALRQAMAEGCVQRATALAMLLICEVFLGGYCLNVDDLRLYAERKEAEKQNRLLASIGAKYEDMAKAERECINIAIEDWRVDPEKRIGKVAEHCRKVLLAHVHLLPTLHAADIPDTPQIKRWISDADRTVGLRIPPNARKPGRDRKK